MVLYKSSNTFLIKIISSLFGLKSYSLLVELKGMKPVYLTVNRVFKDLLIFPKIFVPLHIYTANELSKRNNCFKKMQEKLYFLDGIVYLTVL